MVSRVSDHPREQGGTIRLSDDQFDRLVELLVPGHKMASLMLDHHEKASALAASQFGGETAGTDVMDPGPQYRASSEPIIDDLSKRGESDNMGTGPQATGSGQVPEPDDPSKQGSG